METKVGLESTEFQWLEPVYIDTDKLDSKGRRIGYQVKLYTQVYVVSDSGTFTWEDASIGRVAGRVYCAFGQNTRNGKKYAASTDSRYFTTEEKARDWAMAQLTTFMIKHGVNYVRPAA
jgi:hypothetical protein